MANRIVRWLTDPGPGSGPWRLLPRLALAAFMLPAGLGKFVNYDAYVDRFERWGFGAPGAMALITGTIEVAAALLILVGLAPRVGALALVGVMVGALVTAGRIDGGSNIWLPIVVIALAVTTALVGSGPWRTGGFRADSGVRSRRRPSWGRGGPGRPG